jgi:hypothetical protein
VIRTGRARSRFSTATVARIGRTNLSGVDEDLLPQCSTTNAFMTALAGGRSEELEGSPDEVLVQLEHPPCPAYGAGLAAILF